MNIDKIGNPKLDFNDILIQPAIITDIESRSEVNPFDENQMLPIITAPMDTVVNIDNIEDFYWHNKINICLPRGHDSEVCRSHRKILISLSLDEFIKKYNSSDSPNKLIQEEFVLIDIANGHMLKMVSAVKTAKEKYGNKLFIMAGNIAHPDTYMALSNAGADAIRVGIGNGNGCLTTQQTGVGYPMASLIRDCYNMSLVIDKPSLIVADGGMKNYSDIIKALALGANYVMIGSLLNKALESCGETRIFKYFKINPKSPIARWTLNFGFKLTKRFRGMSTKEVQKNWGKGQLKTSEGIVRIRPVEYTLSQWTTNFEDYLRSAMSYSNCRTLEEFRTNASINIISEQSYKRFNK